MFKQDRVKLTLRSYQNDDSGLEKNFKIRLYNC
jgi:hypothetical protein